MFSLFMTFSSKYIVLIRSSPFCSSSCSNKYSTIYCNLEFCSLNSAIYNFPYSTSDYNFLQLKHETSSSSYNNYSISCFVTILFFFISSNYYLSSFVWLLDKFNCYKYVEYSESVLFLKRFRRSCLFSSNNLLFSSCRVWWSVSSLSRYSTLRCNYIN